MKKNMRKIAGILMIAAIIVTSMNLSQAQQNKQEGPPPLPNSTQIKKMVAELSSSLKLNDEQNKQVFNLYTSHFKEVSAKIEASKPSRKEMEALRSKFEKDIKSLLTAEQQIEFENFNKKHAPDHNGQPKPNS